MTFTMERLEIPPTPTRARKPGLPFEALQIGGASLVVSGYSLVSVGTACRYHGAKLKRSFSCQLLPDNRIQIWRTGEAAQPDNSAPSLASVEWAEGPGEAPQAVPEPEPVLSFEHLHPQQPEPCPACNSVHNSAWPCLFAE